MTPTLGDLHLSQRPYREQEQFSHTGDPSSDEASTERMWGGGKRASPSSASSSVPGPANRDRPVAQIWLPDGYEKEVVAFIEAEEDVVQKGGVQRCFDSILEQTTTCEPMDARSGWCMIGADGFARRLRQFEITFRDGLDPFRLTWILERLCADLNLVDDSVWEENAAVLASLPEYCNACDNFGHTHTNCAQFAKRARVEAGFVPRAHMSGMYILRKLGLNQHLERVIMVAGKQWDVKTATGVDYNCLIDTVRQSLGLALYDGYLDRVRRDLANEFPASRGDLEVRVASHPLGANFLEFLEHTRSVARRLIQHAADAGRDGVDHRVENMKFVCVDLDTGRASVLDASAPGAREFIFVRENGNHFLPLERSHALRRDLLMWDTNVAAVRAQSRREKEEAAKAAAARRKEEELKQAAEAAARRSQASSGSCSQDQPRPAVGMAPAYIPEMEELSGAEEPLADANATRVHDSEGAPSLARGDIGTAGMAKQGSGWRNGSTQTPPTPAVADAPAYIPEMDVLSGAEEPLDDLMADPEAKDPPPPREAAMTLEAWGKMMRRTQNDEGSEQNEASDVDSQAGALSDASVESDAEDVFYVKALAKTQRRWTTEEDRELERIEKLAAELREQPHLPRDPTDPEAERPLLNRELLDSYIDLPYAHCMIKGCTWVQQHPCKFRRPPEYYLLRHLQASHRDLFKICCGERCDATDKYCEEGEYLDYLEEAMKFKAEAGDMPEVNGAVDRRSLTYLHAALGDTDVHAYFCFICNERHLHLRSYDHRQYSKYKGTIEYFSLRDIYYAMNCGEKKNTEAFKGKWDANFSWDLFVERYMQPWAGEACENSQPEHGFVSSSWEWRRQLCFDVEGKKRRTAVCCPEDVSWFINTPSGKLVLCCHRRSLRQLFCIMFDVNL